MRARDSIEAEVLPRGLENFFSHSFRGRLIVESDSFNAISLANLQKRKL